MMNNILSNNNNNDNNNNDPSISSVSGRFATFNSSPSLDDTSQTISFASLNVRGLNNPTKFDSLLADFSDLNISVVALQETHLSEATASHLFRNFQSHSPSHFQRSYWSFDSSDRAGGVGIILAPFVSKYVQKIH